MWERMQIALDAALSAISTQPDKHAREIANWPDNGAPFGNRWFKDAPAFVQVLRSFKWTSDFRFKYVGLRIDTRDGSFVVQDRDGNEVTPDDLGLRYAALSAISAQSPVGLAGRLPSGAPDALAALKLAEGELMSLHGLYGDEANAEAHSAALRAVRAAIAQAEAGTSGTSEDGSFQSRVDPWLITCFGEEIARDKVERNHRFLEEALELVQAGGCTASEAHQLVDYVFGRPVGEMAQEVGGVMNTLAALCLAHGLDMHEAAEIELARVWTKVEKIRAKQAAKPKHSPLPEHVPASSPEPSRQGVEAMRDLTSLIPDDPIERRHIYGYSHDPHDQSRDDAALAQPQGAGPSERGA